MVFAGLFGQASPAPTEVILPYGSVRGNLLPNAREFLGIPYAKPPARFAAPEAWTDDFAGGLLDAMSYTAQCMQPQAAVDPSALLSEDCLHLNVYTPCTSISQGLKPLPVMLWLHGGGLVTGSAMLSMYNASRLAANENVIVVAANFRLGIFGFGTTQQHGSFIANNGLLDQRMSMRWVRKHIGAFGGDSNSLTIFGQSGGAKAVGLHVLMPGSKGLFDRAIMQSGYVMDATTVEDASADMTTLGKALGCNEPSLSCLRALNASSLAEASLTTYASSIPVVIDGLVMPAWPQELVRSDAFNHVPFLLGSNSDEANLLLGGQQPMTADVVRCVLEKEFNESTADAVMRLYGGTTADNTIVLSQLITDVLFACEARGLARRLTEAKAAPWVYSFRRQSACGVLLEGATGVATGINGAAHGAEIAYVFQRLHEMAPENCSVADLELDQSLSNTIAGVWATFAREGKPPVSWPRFSAMEGMEPVAVLDIGSTADAVDFQTGFRRGQCDILDSVGKAGMAINVDVLTKYLPECQSSVPAIVV